MYLKFVCDTTIICNNQCSPCYYRYNGLLGDYSLNNHSVSRQIMRKFVIGHQLARTAWPDLTSERILKSLADNAEDRGTLSAFGNDIEHHAKLALASILKELDLTLPKISNDVIQYPSSKQLKWLDDTYYQWLCAVYAVLYSENNMPIVNRWVEAVDSIVYKGEYFQVDNEDKVNCNIVRAHWLKSGHHLHIDPSEKLARAGIIRNIYVSRHESDGNISHLVLLEVEWFSSHDDAYAYGHRVQMYHKTFCTAGKHSLVPIQRVISKCALYQCEHQNISVYIVIPLAGQWAM